MKLSEFLSGVGRPVAFYPGLVKALGDRNEAIFICQMAYWRGKGDSKSGWIYKTREEIEEETSLTYKEQMNVRAGLVEKGLLEESYERTSHRMYYRVMWNEVNKIWEHFTDGQLPQFTDGQLAVYQKSSGTLPMVSSLNSNTETTTETTAETTAETHKRGDLVDAELHFLNSPGLKKKVRIDTILGIIGNVLHVNSETKKWVEFAKFAEERQRLHGEEIHIFLNWMQSQKGYDLQYWPPSKMIEHWPRAFVKSENQKPELSADEIARKMAIAAQLIGGKNG